MLDIAIMTAEDIEFAVSMTDFERWGYTADDFRRLLSFEPEGCFMAREEGTRIGIITSTSYDDYGFIGSLIVRASHRGRRVGEMLLRRAMDHLQEKSVTCIELDGVFPAVSLYRRLGFRDKYISLRLWRHADQDAHVKTETTNAGYTPDDIAAYDFSRTGIRRKHLFHSYTSEFDRHLFTIDSDKISGYALIRHRAGVQIAIGPMVADSDPVAEKLVGDIIGRFGHQPLAVGVPAVNPAAADMFLRQGFVYGPPSVRMYLGDRRDYEQTVYAIFSAEKG